jgi:hypothetical protein
LHSRAHRDGDKEAKKATSYYAKSLIRGLLVLLAALALAAPGHALNRDDHNCLKCHSLAEKEVRGILERLGLPDAKVLGIGGAPMKGLWQVDVEQKGRRMVIYVDFAKKLVSPDLPRC